jgi:HEPN domain-containing protein
MINEPKDWFEQADYDYETALCMAKGERYVYTVFMCHLAIEKALKGLVLKVSHLQPPKIHSLIQLTKKAKLDPPAEIGHFLVALDQASIPTRYPEDLTTVKKIYTKDKTEEILSRTKGTLIWLKNMS